MKDVKKNKAVSKIKTDSKKETKITKDELLNTPKDLGNQIKIMPYDEKTLKTFKLKEMNFKDMTGYQKTILVAVFILFLSILILFVLPTLSNVFGGKNIGNINFFNKEEKEDEKEKEAYAYEGDYITLGKNVSLTVGNIKFSNFTKSSDNKLIFNYLALEDIKDVFNKKIYIEVYSTSKSLLSRFLYDPQKDLENKKSGIYSVNLSSNNFNKATFIVVRIITDVLKEELPADQKDDYNNEENKPTGNEGNEEKPNKPVSKNDLVCYYNNVDGSLKIEKDLVATFKTDKLNTYKITYKITSLIETLPKNYSSYYKEMMTLYKKLMASPGCETYINDNGLNASLEYTLTLSKYKDIEIDEEYKDSYAQDYLDQKTPYQLEIKKDSTKIQSIKELEIAEWTCD